MTFSLPGVPVTVHWSFLFVAVLGFGYYQDFADIAAWTVAVFAAVLLHECGHAYTSKAYGATNVTVTLFALGGYTTWLPRPSITAGKRFVISAAGSAVGIGIGLLASRFVEVRIRGWTLGNDVGFDGPLEAFLATIVLVGLFWGVLNWIPLLPLDGGHMLNHALAIFWPDQAYNIALGVSTVVGVGLIGAAFYYGQTFMAIFLIFILMSAWRSRPEATEAPSQPQQPAAGERPYDPQPYPPAEATPPEEQEPPAFPI